MLCSSRRIQVIPREDTGNLVSPSSGQILTLRHLVPGKADWCRTCDVQQKSSGNSTDEGELSKGGGSADGGYSNSSPTTPNQGAHMATQPTVHLLVSTWSQLQTATSTSDQIEPICNPLEAWDQESTEVPSALEYPIPAEPRRVDGLCQLFKLAPRPLVTPEGPWQAPARVANFRLQTLDPRYSNIGAPDSRLKIRGFRSR